MRRKKFLLLGGLAVAAVLTAQMSIAPAGATPSKSSLCLGCHNPDPNVTATVVQTGPLTFSYNITGPNSGLFGFGVFNGSTKVKGAYGASGTFTVPAAGTYTFFGVNNDPATMDGYTQLSVTTAAPTPTPVPPTPTPVPPTPTPVPPVVSPAPIEWDGIYWELKGTVESINGNTWRVSGVTITVTSNTKIEGRPRVGSTVKAKGIKRDDKLIARKIEVKSSDDDDEDDEDDHDD